MQLTFLESKPMAFEFALVSEKCLGTIWDAIWEAIALVVSERWLMDEGILLCERPNNYCCGHNDYLVQFICCGIIYCVTRIMGLPEILFLELFIFYTYFLLRASGDSR